jgi:hypothetical protein
LNEIYFRIPKKLTKKLRPAQIEPTQRLKKLHRFDEPKYKIIIKRSVTEGCVPRSQWLAPRVLNRRKQCDCDK